VRNQYQSLTRFLARAAFSDHSSVQVHSVFKFRCMNSKLKIEVIRYSNFAGHVYGQTRANVPTHQSINSPTVLSTFMSTWRPRDSGSSYGRPRLRYLSVCVLTHAGASISPSNISAISPIRGSSKGGPGGRPHLNLHDLQTNFLLSDYNWTSAVKIMSFYS